MEGIKIPEAIRKLNEDLELYKGIFWIPYPEDPEKNRNYCFKIACDTYGESTQTEDAFLAKSGSTYNHKIVWEKLDRQWTMGRAYNYFPRGRVEIRNGVAKIFLNQNIATEEIVGFLKKEFNLIPHNGIKDVKTIVDNSAHYLCYLDDGFREDK